MSKSKMTEAMLDEMATTKAKGEIIDLINSISDIHLLDDIKYSITQDINDMKIINKYKNLNKKLRNEYDEWFYSITKIHPLEEHDYDESFNPHIEFDMGDHMKKEEFLERIFTMIGKLEKYVKKEHHEKQKNEFEKLIKYLKKEVDEFEYKLEYWENYNVYKYM